jgi:hypothetical protein
MRDKKWVLEHRGGILSIEKQKILMKWAIHCVVHLFPLLNNNINEKIIEAINIGNNWIIGQVKTGEAIKTAREIIKYIKTLDNKLEVAITRDAGHAVSTAHMADHAMGPVKYGLDAIKIIKKKKKKEIEWHINNFPIELKEQIMEGLLNKKIFKKKDLEKYI